MSDICFSGLCALVWDERYQRPGARTELYHRCLSYRMVRPKKGFSAALKRAKGGNFFAAQKRSVRCSDAILAVYKGMLSQQNRFNYIIPDEVTIRFFQAQLAAENGCQVVKCDTWLLYPGA